MSDEPVTNENMVHIGRITREALIEALQTAWDDWCGDTGCFPECFTVHRGRITADFQRSNFVTQVAAQLQLEVRKSHA